jgi:hypothetical protein
VSALGGDLRQRNQFLGDSSMLDQNEYLLFGHPDISPCEVPCICHSTRIRECLCRGRTYCAPGTPLAQSAPSVLPGSSWARWAIVVGPRTRCPRTNLRGFGRYVPWYIGWP